MIPFVPDKIKTNPILEVSHLDKTFAGGFEALKDINLNIEAGEIFALLGPNGAGKTTLISAICGITNITRGSVSVGGFDNIRQYRATRSLIGLVPQELTKDAFETVWNTVSFSRGLFGKPPNPVLIEKILKDLSLWNKRDSKLMTLSGGMKRRVMIAKALSHEPRILFLDEPTAGVDVDLRKSMWEQMHALRESGVTIILTTHYIDEAEQMADRIGIINHGRIILVEEKSKLIEKLGSKQISIELREPIGAIPNSLAGFNLKIDGQRLVYTYNSNEDHNQIPGLLENLSREKIQYNDLNTKQSSLEEIFVNLVRDK